MGLDVKGAVGFQFYQVRFKQNEAQRYINSKPVSILSSTI